MILGRIMILIENIMHLSIRLSRQSISNLEQILNSTTKISMFCVNRSSL